MHYVCSDIHGRYNDYLKILEMIDFKGEDTLYVLGDAIDRGNRPIDVLLDIKHRHNVIFLIGNHEHMMIQSELYNDRMALYDWIQNGGETTLQQLEQLPSKEKLELMTWLTKQLLIEPCLKVSGRRYYLAHACHTLADDYEEIRYCDAPQDVIRRVTWDRTYRNPIPSVLDYRFHNLYKAYPNTTLIIGHTPVQYCSYGITTDDGSGRISKSRKGHLINIDCGCAKGKPLGCLRLEDGKEFYVKQNINL